MAYEALDHDIVRTQPRQSKNRQTRNFWSEPFASVYWLVLPATAAATNGARLGPHGRPSKLL